MRQFFRRLDSLMAKVNGWLAPAASAVGTSRGDGQAQQADASHIATALGEVKRSRDYTSDED